MRERREEREGGREKKQRGTEWERERERDEREKKRKERRGDEESQWHITDTWQQRIYRCSRYSSHSAPPQIASYFPTDRRRVLISSVIMIVFHLLVSISPTRLSSRRKLSPLFPLNLVDLFTFCLFLAIRSYFSFSLCFHTEIKTEPL
jgi:hypothetical protein